MLLELAVGHAVDTLFTILMYSMCKKSLTLAAHAKGYWSRSVCSLVPRPFGGGGWGKGLWTPKRGNRILQ